MDAVLSCTSKRLSKHIRFDWDEMRSPAGEPARSSVGHVAAATMPQVEYMPMSVTYFAAFAKRRSPGATIG